jgi:hypothetical protein
MNNQDKRGTVRVTLVGRTIDVPLAMLPGVDKVTLDTATTAMRKFDAAFTAAVGGMGQAIAPLINHFQQGMRAAEILAGAIARFEDIRGKMKTPKKRRNGR